MTTKQVSASFKAELFLQLAGGTASVHDVENSTGVSAFGHEELCGVVFGCVLWASVNVIHRTSRGGKYLK